MSTVPCKILEFDEKESVGATTLGDYIAEYFHAGDALVMTHFDSTFRAFEGAILSK